MCRGTPDRFLTIKEVIARTRISRGTIYRKIQNGSFPSPRKIGDRAVRWLESDIQDWMDGCPRATDDSPT